MSNSNKLEIYIIYQENVEVFVEAVWLKTDVAVSL